MRRHPFDPISLVFGLLFAATGLVVLLDGSLVDEGAFLAPVGLISLGLALLYQARRRREPEPSDTTSDDTRETEHAELEMPAETAIDDTKIGDAAELENAAELGDDDTKVDETAEVDAGAGVSEPRSTWPEGGGR